MGLKLIIVLLQVYRSYAHTRTTYCDPYSHQVCPNGQLCQRSLLHCQTTKNGVMYCLCPDYSYEHRPHYYSDYYSSHEPRHHYYSDYYSSHEPRSDYISHNSDVVVEISHDDDDFSHQPELPVIEYRDDDDDHHRHHRYHHPELPVIEYRDDDDDHAYHNSDFVVEISHDDDDDHHRHHRYHHPELPVIEYRDDDDDHAYHHRHHRYHHLLPHDYIHCDPSSFQFCPNGGPVCDPNILDCSEDGNGPVYCICPGHGFSHHHYRDDDDDHHRHRHILPHDDVHCDPSAFQVCPNGGPVCDPNILDCTEDGNGPVYCICPGHHHRPHLPHQHERIEVIVKD